MAEHGARVTQTEIDVGVAIGILEVNAFSRCDEQIEWRAPIHHPMHGNTAKPVFCSLFGERLRRRIATGKYGFFPGKKVDYGFLRNCNTHDALLSGGRWTTLAGPGDEGQAPVGFCGNGLTHACLQQIMDVNQALGFSAIIHDKYCGDPLVVDEFNDFT
jgi:hypothetical protein